MDAVIDKKTTNPDLGLDFMRAEKMQKLVIAFDVDGTLILRVGDTDVPQVPIINTLQVLSKLTKNVRIIVWSGGGKEYAEMWGRRLGLDDYVWKYMAKDRNEPVDICFDDMQACMLADKNIIVRLK